MADNLHNMYEMEKYVKEKDLGYLNNFSAKPEDKMEYETKRLEIFKKYYKGHPLIRYIQKHITYLNNRFNTKT